MEQGRAASACAEGVPERVCLALVPETGTWHRPFAAAARSPAVRDAPAWHSSSVHAGGAPAYRTCVARWSPLWRLRPVRASGKDALLAGAQGTGRHARALSLAPSPDGGTRVAPGPEPVVAPALVLACGAIEPRLRYQSVWARPGRSKGVGPEQRRRVMRRVRAHGATVRCGYP
ncbi:hypothetical protein ACSSS7_003598 [Eimeria intestinalis]